MRRDSLSPLSLVVIFAAAYAVALLAIAIVPVNLQLAHYFPDEIRRLWTSSAVRLIYRVVTAAVGCAFALAVTGRLRGALSAPLITPVVALAGLLAGVIEIVIGKLLLHRMVALNRSAPIAAWIAGIVITLVIATAVSLILSLRVKAPQAA